MLTVVALAVAVFAAAAIVVRIIGPWRWRAATARVVADLHSRRRVPAIPRYLEGELEGLPAPVARYFRHTLRDGQPMITAVRLEQEGRFRMSEAEDSWRPFTAVQTFATTPPAFVWDAAIRMAPGLPVLVRDAYLAGSGTMRGAVLGLVTMVDAHGAPELASGALMRYLAEAMWFPTKLLPSQGVRWEAMDDSTARAVLADGPTSVALEFHFGAAGDVTEVLSPGRHREVKGTYELAPWGATSTAFDAPGGLRIPVDTEVWWMLDGRRYPYWRGRITKVEYVFAP